MNGDPIRGCFGILNAVLFGANLVLTVFALCLIIKGGQDVLVGLVLLVLGAGMLAWWFAPEKRGPGC